MAAGAGGAGFDAALRRAVAVRGCCARPGCPQAAAPMVGGPLPGPLGWWLGPVFPAASEANLGSCWAGVPPHLMQLCRSCCGRFGKGLLFPSPRRGTAPLLALGILQRAELPQRAL